MLPDLADLAALTAWGVWRTLTRPAYADRAHFTRPIRVPSYRPRPRSAWNPDGTARQQPPWDGKPTAERKAAP